MFKPMSDMTHLSPQTMVWGLGHEWVWPVVSSRYSAPWSLRWQGARPARPCPTGHSLVQTEPLTTARQTSLSTTCRLGRRHRPPLHPAVASWVLSAAPLPPRVYFTFLRPFLPSSFPRSFVFPGSLKGAEGLKMPFIVEKAKLNSLGHEEPRMPPLGFS